MRNKIILWLSVFIMGLMSFTTALTQSMKEGGMVVTNGDTTKIKYSPNKVWRSNKELLVYDVSRETLLKLHPGQNIVVILVDRKIMEFEVAGEKLFLYYLLRFGHIKLLANRDLKNNETFYLQYENDQIEQIPQINISDFLKDKLTDADAETLQMLNNTLLPDQVNYNRTFFENVIQSYNSGISPEKYSRSLLKLKYNRLKSFEFGFHKNGIVTGTHHQRATSPAVWFQNEYTLMFYESEIDDKGLFAPNETFSSYVIELGMPLGLNYKPSNNRLQGQLGGGVIPRLSFHRFKRDESAKFKTKFGAHLYASVGLSTINNNSKMYSVMLRVINGSDLNLWQLLFRISI